MVLHYIPINQANPIVRFPDIGGTLTSPSHATKTTSVPSGIGVELMKRSRRGASGLMETMVEPMAGLADSCGKYFGFKSYVLHIYSVYMGYS